MLHHRTTISIGAAVALLFGVWTTPVAASERPDGSGFSCRASAVQAVFPPYPAAQPPSIEPLVANRADAPCADGSEQIIGRLTAGPAAIDTVRVSTHDGEGDAAVAGASVERVTITGLPLPITATMLTADAAFTCVGGQPVGAGASSVSSLTVGGVPISIPQGDNTVIKLPPWDTIVLTLNQVIVTPTKVTRRALFVDFNGNTGLPDLTIAEATAGFTGDPCAAAAVTPPAATPSVAMPAPPADAPSPADAPPPASARLTTIVRRSGPARCIRPPLIARVAGVNVDQVTFMLDGKPTWTDRSAPFRMRIGARALKAAARRLTARVVFRSATRTSPRILSRSLRRCVRHSAG